MIHQDVAFAVKGVDLVWPDAALERIADLITRRGGDVYIVLSNIGAAGAVGDTVDGNWALRLLGFSPACQASSSAMPCCGE